MSQKPTKEKWTDFFLSVAAILIIFACLAVLPKACDTEYAMRQERTAAFLAE